MQSRHLQILLHPGALQTADVRDQGNWDSPDLSNSQGVTDTVCAFRAGGRSLGNYKLCFSLLPHWKQGQRRARVQPW